MPKKDSDPLRIQNLAIEAGRNLTRRLIISLWVTQITSDPIHIENAIITTREVINRWGKNGKIVIEEIVRRFPKNS